MAINMLQGEQETPEKTVEEFEASLQHIAPDSTEESEKKSQFEEDMKIMKNLHDEIKVGKIQINIQLLMNHNIRILMQKLTRKPG